MTKPDYQRTKEEKEDLTVSVIEDMIQKGENKDFINKIASAVTSTTTKQKKKGEVSELMSYLRKEAKW